MSHCQATQHSKNGAQKLTCHKFFLLKKFDLLYVVLKLFGDNVFQLSLTPVYEEYMMYT